MVIEVIDQCTSAGVLVLRQCLDIFRNSYSDNIVDSEDVPNEESQCQIYSRTTAVVFERLAISFVVKTVTEIHGPLSSFRLSNEIDDDVGGVRFGLY